MSCQNCDDFNDTGQIIYYRWKNANVIINGCKKHVLEIFRVLNDAQEVGRVKEEKKV